MLAVPALALLLAQPGSACTDDPGHPAAVHICRADQHLAAFQAGARENPETDRHLREAIEDLVRATTAAHGSADFGVAGLKLVRLFAPDRLNAPDKAVPVLQSVIEAEPANLAARFTLAAVLEAQGDIQQAGHLLEQTRAAFPDDRSAAAQLAAFNHRGAARLWERLSRSPELDAPTRLARLEDAAGAESRALAIDPDLTEALVTKELIVRALADAEQNATRRAALLTEANDLRARAARPRQGLGLAAVARGPARSPGAAAGMGSEWLRPPSRSYRGVGGAPVPAPPPDAPAAAPSDAAPPVGVEFPPPRRVKYVAPVYPQDAIEMNVEGTVAIEVRIDEQGKVVEAKVVQSVPLLDEAALAAVRQWEYAPTVAGGKAIAIAARVTVGFTLKE